MLVVARRCSKVRAAENATVPMRFGRGARSRVFLGLEFFDVSLKLWEGSPAPKVKANHLIGSLVRLSTGVDQNQQASDDRQVHLDLDTVRLLRSTLRARPSSQSRCGACHRNWFHLFQFSHGREPRFRCNELDGPRQPFGGWRCGGGEKGQEPFS